MLIIGTLVLLEIADENTERYQTPGPVAVNVSPMDFRGLVNYRVTGNAQTRVRL